MPKSLDEQLVDVAGWSGGTDDEVRDLLARGADVNSRAGNGCLIFAAAANRRSTAEILVAAGARIDSIDYPTNTPLMHAASAAMAKLLLDHGARVDGTGMYGDALHRAIDRGDDVELARVLIDHGLRVLGYRPGAEPGRLAGHLEHATTHKRSAIAALLLERGCRADEVTHDGKPMLDHALVYSDAIALAVIAQGAVIEPSHLELACRWRDAEVIAVVLRATSGDATGAAEIAAERGGVEVLRILIESDRVTRLDAPLRAAARFGQAEAVELLLRCGADPCQRDDHGCSAVHAAAQGGSIALLERFVAAGCPLDADSAGRTTLHHAARGTGDPTAMLGELVRRGVDLEARDREGATALAACARDVHTSSYDTLIALGADPSTGAAERQAAIDEREAFERRF